MTGLLAGLLTAMLPGGCATPNVTRSEVGGLPRPAAKIVIDAGSSDGMQTPVASGCPRP
jgi:hypothetical protein